MCAPCWTPILRSAQRYCRGPFRGGAFDWVLEYGKSLISIATVAELNEVLRRSHFNRYVSEEERLELLATLMRESELVGVTVSVSVCRDPKDNKFLELAVSGAATHIISGDDDLLELHPFRGVAIVSPQDFVVLQTNPA